MDGQTDIETSRISPHSTGLCTLSGPLAKKKERDWRERGTVHTSTNNKCYFQHICAQIVAPKNILSMVPISVILHEVLSLSSKGNTRIHATID